MILRFLFCILFFLCSCSGEEPETPAPEPAIVKERTYSCRDCHDVQLDKNHRDITCTDCHNGNDDVQSEELIHENLIKRPAHPFHMEQTCGPCHPNEVNSARHSLHFTLKNETNSVRRAFGAEHDLQSLADIPQHEEISSALSLAEDLLRRRCLRCHVYYEGDAYPETIRGTGCAACHLLYSAGKMSSHSFVKSPPDSQCLHCHQGNYVGADYYGRFEHDHHWDYRSPYLKDGTTSRPYGVEFHQLSEDVHKMAGLSCIDCHSGQELMRNSTIKTTCRSCHFPEPDKPLPVDNLIFEEDRLLLTTRLTNSTKTVPRAVHPAHDKYKEKAGCAVCHAQWAFTDEATHLFRIDVEEFDPWGALFTQGSSEVEDQVVMSLYGDESYPYVFMRDKITGELYTGLWLKGFELRRWEFPIICKDEEGVLQICRPLLDLHLSYVNENEDLIFDAISPTSGPPSGLLPYVPHTIGKAGAFFSERLLENSDLLKHPLNLHKLPEKQNTP